MTFFCGCKAGYKVKEKVKLYVIYEMKNISLTSSESFL